MSTDDEKEQVDYIFLTRLEKIVQAQVDIAQNEIDKVVWKYFQFLKIVAKTLTDIKDDEDKKKREKRKFLAIKKEFFNFLNAHRKFYNINEITVELKDSSVLYKKTINITLHGNDFIKLEDILNIIELTDKNTGGGVWISALCYKREIIDAIKLKQGKPFLTMQDVHQYFENNCLFEKSDFNTNCSTYADLADHIEQRIEDYCGEEISVENINQMSFRFRGSIKDYEDEESCPICLNDYETDQEVCRLPCNHFCCRNCTEKMFSTPNEGLQSSFLCPICREDCT